MKDKYTFDAASWLISNKYPYTDFAPLVPSTYTFSNGALYGIEVPVINSFDTLHKTVKYLKELNVKCDRFNETKGTFLLSDSEITDMLTLCREENIGMLFSLSARPEYDTQASFYRSKFGLEQCRKINNISGIAACLDEAFRLTELGCTGIIVYDPGVLFLLNQLKSEKKLPSNLFLKTSSHCMATNPFIAKILHETGANSITTIHDMSLPTLSHTRQLCSEVILDIPTDVYKDKGGFIRFHDLGNIVRVAAPCFLKVGASAQANPYDEISENTVKKRCNLIAVAIEHLLKQLDNQHQDTPPDSEKCIPLL